MLHPNCSVTGFYDENLESWRGPAGQLIHSMEFYETRVEHDFVRGAKLHALPTPGPLNAVEVHRELPYDQLWGSAIHDIARSHARGILWAANAEDLPDEANTVTLDPDLTDGDGVPAPKIRYRISDNTRKILRFAVQRMEEIHAASGAVETFPVELWVDQPGHLLGTARMGNDPATSVVDCYGRAHDVPNVTTPLLALLPDLMHIPAGSGHHAVDVRLLATELADPQLAARTVLDRLVDVLLIQLIRACCAPEPTGNRHRGCAPSATRSSLPP